MIFFLKKKILKIRNTTPITLENSCPAPECSNKLAQNINKKFFDMLKKMII